MYLWQSSAEERGKSMSHLPTCQTRGNQLERDNIILSVSLQLPGALDFTREENMLALCGGQKMGWGRSFDRRLTFPKGLG